MKLLMRAVPAAAAVFLLASLAQRFAVYAKLFQQVHLA
jgi:hypothetical protein